MEHHLEARLWNDVFKLAQDYIAIPRGTIRGTVLIETITAVFHVRVCSGPTLLTRQMDEIIFELKEHSAGLNCGRWDCPSPCLGRPDARRHLLVHQEEPLQARLHPAGPQRRHDDRAVHASVGRHRSSCSFV